MPVAAFVPSPPLLVDGLTGGEVGEVDDLRDACRAVVRRLLDVGPAQVALIGPDPRVPAGTVAVRWPGDARGTLGGFGSVTAPSDATTVPRVDPELPLSLTVGRWLLDDAGYDGPVLPVAVAEDADAEDCLSLGATVGADALLVVGDGSNRRGLKPPGGPDPRADRFDAAAAAALAAGDAGALAALDASLAAELGVSGRATWQVLAGWVSGRRVEAAQLSYEDAPFGVGYLVGTWTVH